MDETIEYGLHRNGFTEMKPNHGEIKQYLYGKDPNKKIS